MRTLDYLKESNERTIGFFATLEDAEFILKECVETINEDSYYNYCVVEELEFGLYPLGLSRWFYKFNMETGIYESIEEPEELKCVVGFYE